MNLRRIILMLSLAATIPWGVIRAQAIAQPPVHQRSVFEVASEPADPGLPERYRREPRRSRLETFLSAGIAGALLGTLAAFTVTCIHSNDKSCQLKTISAFAAGAGTLAILATF